MSKAILIDSNILIYCAKYPEQAEIFQNTTPHYAIITVIETLGYQRITAGEAAILQMALKQATGLALDAPVIDQAIQLRQARRMSLGDAIIAATALVHDLELWTGNLKDFMHIRSLRLRDPLIEAT